jgi:hypothetical protein
MKKIYAIILAMTVSYIAYGQISKTLVAENKLWSNLWQTASGGPPPHEMITNYIKFSADTLIGGEIYKKVLESTDELQADFTVIGYIREDSLKKVYYRDKNETESKLLYDFGAEVGDSIMTGEFVLVVETIDSVLINNEYLKRVELSNEGLVGEIWIEGIGSLCGILSSGYYGVTGGKYDLLCFYESEELMYSNPEFENCFYNTVGIREFETNRLRVEIIPNPVISSSIMRIEGEFNHDLMIEIFSLDGVKIKTIRPAKSSHVIRKEDYFPGVYIFRVTKTNAGFITGKFIVK